MAQLTIQQAFDLAVRQHQAGRLQEAEQLCRRILAQQPAHTGALHLLGLIAHQVGRNDMAADLIRRAISLQGDYPEACNNLGNVLMSNGRVDEAIAAFRQAIGLRPDLAPAHSNLGNALRSKGRLDEAIAACRQALALNPDTPEPHNDLGNVLRDKGRLEEAIAAYRQAIALRPNYADAYNNLGVALKDAGQREEALAACRQAIDLMPGLAEAHNNLGVVLEDNGQAEEAISAYRQAIGLRPDYVDAYNNLGVALKDEGQLDEAIAAFREAAARSPGDASIDSNIAFTLQYHPAYDARAIAEEERRWNQRHGEPLAAKIRPHSNDRSPERLLRIGYVSPYFYAQAGSFFMIPLLESHDHQGYEIHCYSDTACPDEFTQRIRGAADVWHLSLGQNNAELAEQIRGDGIDILVDLAMHMGRNRLPAFARKPAPVQASWLAYPGSTGLSAIDYRLSDPYLDPAGMDESIYSERTVRLPDSFWCYDPLDGRDIPVNSLPALETGAVTFGCLNNFCKVNEGVLVLWAQVLRQVEGSRLLLMAAQGSHRQRTLERLRQEEIDPGRVEFFAYQPRRAYLELYHRIDVGLDSFPYNGHTTSLDSFWMGVPVVTLVGQRAVSRGGWCQLSNLGLSELAGQTAGKFVQIAAALAMDLPRLSELRSTLRRRMEQSPLMDAPKFARNIEAAYRRMWRGWCQTASAQG